jgi:hypothetical protein
MGARMAVLGVVLFLLILVPLALRAVGPVDWHLW